MELELSEFLKNPILAALFVEGIKFLGRYIITEKISKRFKKLFEKCFKKHELKINSLKDERKIKIINYLFSASEDEDFNLKEKGYLFDLENIINNKDYIPIFNKISWDDLLLFERIAENFNIIKNDKEFEFLLKEELKIWPYIPLILLSILNDTDYIKKNNGMPLLIEDLKKPGLMDNDDKNLKENFWRLISRTNFNEEKVISFHYSPLFWLISRTNFNEEKDYLLSIFNKFESLNLIKIGYMPFFEETKTSRRLMMITQKNYIILLTNRGKDILKLINK